MHTVVFISHTALKAREPETPSVWTWGAKPLDHLLVRDFCLGFSKPPSFRGKLSVRLADMNGDGMIQFEEFVKWLYGSEGLSFLLRHSPVSCATSADMTGKQAA